MINTRVRVYCTYMKAKLTLTIDPKVTHQAKQLARRRGISLSAMVEEALVRQTRPASTDRETRSFSERWAGTMRLRDDDSPRTRRLREKHGLME